MNGYSTQEGHIAPDGGRRRSKKESPQQLGLFSDKEKQELFGEIARSHEPPPIQWEVIEIKIERKGAHSVVETVQTNNRGEKRICVNRVYYTEAVAILIEIATTHELPRGWR